MPANAPLPLFCQRLTKHREALGLSQKQLADKIGVGQSSASRWERGASFPDVMELLRLCRFFGVTPDYMTGFRSDTATGLWPDQWITDDEMISEMDRDKRRKGLPLFQVPRQHRLIGSKEAFAIRKRLGLDMVQER